MIKAILNMFKEKGVEISADELAKIAAEEPNKPNFDLSELKHNKAAIEKLYNDFQTEMVSLKDSLTAQIVSLQDENKQLLTALASEKEQRENIVKVQLERAESEKVKSIETLIEEATKDGRLPSENKELQETYKQILLTDIEKGKVILSALPAKVKTTDIPMVTNKPKIDTLDPMADYLNQIEVK